MLKEYRLDKIREETTLFQRLKNWNTARFNAHTENSNLQWLCTDPFLRSYHKYSIAQSLLEKSSQTVRDLYLVC